VLRFSKVTQMEGILKQLHLPGFQMISERTESWHLAMTPDKRH